MRFLRFAVLAVFVVLTCAPTTSRAEEEQRRLEPGTGYSFPTNYCQDDLSSSPNVGCSIDSSLKAGLTSGAYYLTDNLNVSTGWVGLAVREDRVLIDLNGYTISSSGGGVGILVDGSSDVVIRNGTITGFSVGVRVETGAAAHVRLEDLVISSASNVGISLAGSSEAPIQAELVDNVVHHSGIGIFLTRVESGLVRGNHVFESSNQGMRVQSSEGVLFTGNVFAGSEEEGVWIGASRFLSFLGNSVTDNGGAMGGIAIVSAPSPSEGLLISDNQLSGNYDGPGLYCDGMRSTAVIGNTAAMNGLHGISMGSSSEYNVVDRNSVPENASEGIYFGSGTTDNVYSFNLGPHSSLSVLDDIGSNHEVFYDSASTVSTNAPY